MKTDSDAKKLIVKLLKSADIEVNGKRAWDITVHDERLYERVLAHSSLGLGEAYMDGWWDCKAIDQFIERVLRAELDKQVTGNWQMGLIALQARLMNMQSIKRAFQVGQQHYDLGNELYEKMLDKRLVYSCGYWKDAKNLDEAEEAKLDLICRKLGLRRGMRLLDIGCGWGSLVKYAAEKYGVECVGVTVSVEQAKLARIACKGLPVKILVQDYRETTGKFDRVASVGMFEHVGYKNYAEFMRVVDRCLKPGGYMLLHTIAQNISGTKGDPWSEKYIFPNGMLPSISQIGEASQGLLMLEDWQNFGPDYDPTLMAWHANFVTSWPELSASNPQYDERFYRMWTYYLLSFAGGFRARNLQLWQIVFSKGVTTRYDAPR